MYNLKIIVVLQSTAQELEFPCNRINSQTRQSHVLKKQQKIDRLQANCTTKLFT